MLNRSLIRLLLINLLHEIFEEHSNLSTNKVAETAGKKHVRVFFSPVQKTQQSQYKVAPNKENISQSPGISNHKRYSRPSSTSLDATRLGNFWKRFWHNYGFSIVRSFAIAGDGFDVSGKYHCKVGLISYFFSNHNYVAISWIQHETSKVFMGKEAHVTSTVSLEILHWR